jgi:hypothetical protein
MPIYGKQYGGSAKNKKGPAIWSSNTTPRDTPCGKHSGPPKPLGKEWSHCSFCAIALREIAAVQKDSCWKTLFSFCVGLGKPGPKNIMFHIWAFSHSHVTANPSTEIKENKGLPCTPSFLSALLKYSSKNKLCHCCPAQLWVHVVIGRSST